MDERGLLSRNAPIISACLPDHEHCALSSPPPRSSPHFFSGVSRNNSFMMAGKKPFRGLPYMTFNQKYPKFYPVIHSTGALQEHYSLHGQTVNIFCRRGSKIVWTSYVEVPLPLCPMLYAPFCLVFGAHVP